MNLIKRISSSIAFDNIVREQRRLTSEIRRLQEGVSSAKTYADRMHQSRESLRLEGKLNELRTEFTKLGISFYEAADVVEEVGLRAKLESEEITKEQASQLRKDLKSLREKKSDFEKGVAKQTRSWEVFQLRYWGLTGRAVRWLTGISGGALFMKGWKDFYSTGVTAQNMQLETIGKIDEGLTTWGGKATSFSLVKSEIEGTLRAYGVVGVDVDDLTKRMMTYSGGDRDKAEKLFSSLASTARIAQMDFKEVWDYTEQRARKYNRDMGDVASEFHEMVAIADGTSAEVEKQNQSSGAAQTTRGIFRKEYLQSILSVTSEIEESSGYSNQVAVAKLFSSGVVEANNLKSSISTTLTTAKAYTKFLHLDDVYNFQLGINVVSRIDAEIEKKSRGMSVLEGERITREVIFNLAGKDLGLRMKTMYETAKQGGLFTTAPDIGRLWAQTSQGSTEAARINYEAVSKGSSDYGIQLLVTAGMSREEAITAVIAVKAGHIESLNPVQKKLLIAQGYADITAENSKSYQEMITEGAKNIFGGITSTITQVWGNPLTKMAAGLGVMAYVFRKEIKGAFSTVVSWASLAASYMRWAGMEKVREGGGFLSSMMGKVKGVKGKKAALLAGAATVAGLGLTYGTGKAVEWASSPKEDPKSQAKRMIEPASPLGTELSDYVSSQNGKIDPEKVGDIVRREEGVTQHTERLTNQVAMDDALSRDRAMKRSVVESMGGRLVRRNGRDVAEVSFPKFMTDVVSTG